MNAPPGGTPEPHITDDEFLDLVSGFLEGPARERVIAHASSCARCDARFLEISATHERGLARAAQVLVDAAEAPRANPFWRPSLALVAAAGVIVVATAVFLARPQPAPSSRAARAPDPVWLPSAVLEGDRRSGGEALAESLVIEGVKAYDRRDLVEAERLLRTPLPRGGSEWMRRLYLASALVEQGRDAEALPLLDTIHADLLPEPWNAEWGWTFFVALERQGLHARADSVLETLVKLEGDVGDRARAERDARHPRH